MSNISVVIATLGLSEGLNETIQMLNNNTIKPLEIIICIPEEYKKNLAKYTFEQNVNILSTKGKGQVYQRAEGFKNAMADYILQIDDDCFIEKNLLEVLISEIQSRDYPIAIGASLININTGKSFYHRKESKIESFFRWIVNGSDPITPGSVTKAGINFGVDFATIAQKDMLEVEWIPGGCMMIAKENLITENFFPFQGKAYCEDIIHSFLLKKKNIRLFITNKTICKTSLDIHSSVTLRQQVKNFFKESKVRFYYARLSNRSLMRLRMFILFSICKLFSRALLKLV